MNRPVSAMALAIAAVASARDAQALGPVDIEIAAKIGYATSPSGVNGAPNPLGLGVGGRAGFAFKDGLYLGGSVMEYFTGSDSQTNAIGSGNPGLVTQTTTLLSTHVLLAGAEMGYGIKLVDQFTLRPQLGFGDAIFSVSTVSPDTTHWYLEPGVTGLVDLGPLLLGADVNLLMISGLEQASFALDAQVGVKF